MTIGPTGYDEFMNSERSYHVIIQMAKKEMLEQDIELLEEEITQYLLEEYDEQERFIILGENFLKAVQPAVSWRPASACRPWLFRSEANLRG